MNGGVQVERNVSRMEEEILILKQNSDQTNKKVQAMSEKINDVMQQLNKLNNAMDIGIQDLRQLSHQTEINSKKSVSALFITHSHLQKNYHPAVSNSNLKLHSKRKEYCSLNVKMNVMI